MNGEGWMVVYIAEALLPKQFVANFAPLHANQIKIAYYIFSIVVWQHGCTPDVSRSNATGLDHFNSFLAYYSSIALCNKRI